MSVPQCEKGKNFLLDKFYVKLKLVDRKHSNLHFARLTIFSKFLEYATFDFTEKSEW